MSSGLLQRLADLHVCRAGACPGRTTVAEVAAQLLHLAAQDRLPQALEIVAGVCEEPALARTAQEALAQLATLPESWARVQAQNRLLLALLAAEGFL